jgi:hypothetical protein
MLIITQGEEAKATTGISCYVTSPLGYLELWKGTNKHPSPPPLPKKKKLWLPQDHHGGGEEASRFSGKQDSGVVLWCQLPA